MPTIAIVGAGPGLGYSLAKLFGGNGYDVALVSRSRDRLAQLVSSLAEAGVAAESFPADVRDSEALTSALAEATERFGHIDVLEYSPYAGLVRTSPTEVTIEALESQIAEILYGAVTATKAVLPGMLDAGAGTLLYTVGSGSINPFPMLATINAAQAALRNWAHNLGSTLAGTGVYAGVVAIGVVIADTAPDGVPHLPPDEVARAYWDLHTAREPAEHLVTV